MLHSVRTGRPAAEVVHSGGVWGYLAEHREAGAVFNAAMANKAPAQVAAVLAAYDFGEFRTIGDIDRAPAARGVLFDLPRVIDDVRSLGPARLRLQVGDFFKDPPPGCDLYVLMDVLIDWTDAQGLAILQAVRRAAPPRARLLVIEQLVADSLGPHAARALDVHMLTVVGGRQRSRQEYRALLAQAGFAPERTVDTGGADVILEAVARTP